MHNIKIMNNNYNKVKKKNVIFRKATPKHGSID
jgi:hypothetical protein